MKERVTQQSDLQLGSNANLNPVLAPPVPGHSLSPNGSSGEAKAKWLVMIDDHQQGPFTERELKQRIDAGQINPYSLMWRDGWDTWLPLSLITELTTLVDLKRTSSLPPQEKSAKERLAVWAASYGVSQDQSLRNSLRASLSHSLRSSLRVSMVSLTNLGLGPKYKRQMLWKTAGISALALIAIAFIVFAGKNSPTPAGSGVQVIAEDDAMEMKAGVEKASQKNDALAPAAKTAPIAKTAPLPNAPTMVQTPVAPAAPATAIANSATPVPAATKPASAKPVAPKQGVAKPSAASAPAKAEEKPAPAEVKDDGVEFTQAVPGTNTQQASAGNKLDQSELQTTIRNQQGSLRRCYERTIKTLGYEPPAKYDVTLSIAASGAVSNVIVKGPELGTMKACIDAQVRSWHFSESESGATTAFPIVFSGQ